MATRLAANQGNGVCVSTTNAFMPSPKPIDIVLVPAGPKTVETPCVNTAQLALAVKVVASVRINGKPVVVETSEIPVSSGAPPNAIKGKGSPPPANNKCTFTSGQGGVRVGGQPIVRHRDTTLQNAGNCPGAVKLRDAVELNSKFFQFDPGTTEDADKEALVSALEDVAKTPRGKELIDQLQDPAVMKNHKIFLGLERAPGAGSYCEALGSTPDDRFLHFKDDNPLKGNVPGKGTSSLVVLAPDQADRLGLDPGIVMGHELVHAYHNAMGTTIIGGQQLAGHTAETANTELQAMGVGDQSNAHFSESAFRRERFMKDTRLSHDGKNEFPYTPDPGTAPAAGWRTGAGGEQLVYVK